MANQQLQRQSRPPAPKARSKAKTEIVAAASAIRDAVISGIDMVGVLEPRPGVLSAWTVGGIGLSLQTPETTGYVVVGRVGGELKHDLVGGCFSLEISLEDGLKVMKIEWLKPGATPKIIWFKRGPWESWLLYLIESRRNRSARR